MHGTVPDIRNCTELRALLLGGNHLSGTLSMVNDKLRFFDLDNNPKFSGTVPRGIHKTKTTMLNNMRLSGTLPSALLLPAIPSITRRRRVRDDGIQTLSVMRNRIEGSLDNVANYTNLRSLMLSGNYLSCKTPGLHNLTSLGIGSFMEPSRDALLTVGKYFVKIKLLDYNIFEYLRTPYDSAVFVYAGNIGLHLHGSWISPVEPSQLDRVEYLKLGTRGVFQGKCIA